MNPRTPFPLLLSITLLGFWSLYVPQPIQPTLAVALQRSEAEVALLMSATLLPLGLAPILYGLWLGRISSRRLLRLSLALLALSEGLVLLFPSYTGLLSIRVLQGLIIPGLFTALMTYIAGTHQGAGLQRALAIYIATTIVGGFAGRLLSGLLTSWAGWQSPFLVLGVLFALCWWLSRRLAEDPPIEATRIDGRSTLRLLSKPVARYGYVLIFCGFFVFASLLNILPFRLREIQPDIAEWRIALYYLGYLVGALIAWNSHRIVRWCRGIWPSLALGLLAMAGSLPLLLTDDAQVLFATLFVLCAGMFTLHAIMPGYLNQASLGPRGVVNGFYVAFYYTGGALGTWAPVTLYNRCGWSVYLAALAGVLALAAWVLSRLRRAMPVQG